MNELDILCRCGHDKIMHRRNAVGSISCFVCVEYFNKYEVETHSSYAHEYQPDNLTHIEQQAKKKGLI